MPPLLIVKRGIFKPLQGISITVMILELIKLLYPDKSYINSGPRNTPGFFLARTQKKKGVYGI